MSGGGAPRRPRPGGRGFGPGGGMARWAAWRCRRPSPELPGLVRRLLGELRPERPRLVLVVVLAIVSVAFAIVGPEDPRQRHEHPVRRRRRQAARQVVPAGMTQAQLEAFLRGSADRPEHQVADMLSGMQFTPGDGIDFGALGGILLHPRRRLRRERGLQLDAVLHHGRRDPADRLPAAPRGRRQARPAAAALLRRPPARRHPEPRHERHRQHRPDAPAEPDPADHVAVHDHRRARS